MKPFYPSILRITVLIVLFTLCIRPMSQAQCPNGNTPGATMYDTLISFPAGATSMQVKFPKFNPIGGMLTCMRMCITIGGVVDSLSFENTDVDNSHVFSATYNRTDIITGPGLSGAIFSNISKPYSFNLSPSDGVTGSGPDFGKVTRDTIMGSQTCQTVSSESDLMQFYGASNDSVVYNYMISGGVNIASSSNAAIGIATSGFVRVRFSYCTCPATVLPLNIREIFLRKQDDSHVDVNWRGFDDVQGNYYYQAEVSLDGHSFRSIGNMQKNAVGSYKLPYAAGISGMHFFRVKQIYSNGYVRFSEIKQISLENSGEIKFNTFPNPSTGLIGIKFANFIRGTLDVRVYNAQGQTILSKEVEAQDLLQMQVGTINNPGMYWVRVTDKKTLQTNVSQILIK
ncbi:MAG: T9SS type A sorting domain-containing protein [Pedobacter sp.]|nr:MAG: T9SS type A sorting domain-containing protein [Pedobacter sp.]